MNRERIVVQSKHQTVCTNLINIVCFLVRFDRNFHLIYRIFLWNFLTISSVHINRYLIFIYFNIKWILNTIKNGYTTIMLRSVFKKKIKNPTLHIYSFSNNEIFKRWLKSDKSIVKSIDMRSIWALNWAVIAIQNICRSPSHTFQWLIDTLLDSKWDRRHKMTKKPLN